MGQSNTYRKKVKRRGAYQKRRQARLAEAREAGQKAKGKAS